MFGSKSAGIEEEMLNALPVLRRRVAKMQVQTPTVAPEVPGMAKKDEIYIAPTQFTVVSMPFFRWNQ